jgi:stringent starvation protein B
MTSNRPYLIRALFEWITDNGMTPHLIVDAEADDVMVPRGYVDDGRIVLNIAPSAVHGLVLGNDKIHFSARFGGVAQPVELPPHAVLGLYARENGQGMLFPDDGPQSDRDVSDDDGDNGSGGPDGSDDGGNKPARPSLRIVR